MLEFKIWMACGRQAIYISQHNGISSCGIEFKLVLSQSSGIKASLKIGVLAQLKHPKGKLQQK